MKPELILQSDVLDIVFENKNKAYGAYELRRHYHRRLNQSLLVTFLLVLVFAFLQSWKVPHRKGGFMIENFDSLKLVEMKLQPDEPIEKPKEKIIQPKEVADIQLGVMSEKEIAARQMILELEAQLIAAGEFTGVNAMAISEDELTGLVEIEAMQARLMQNFDKK